MTIWYIVSISKSRHDIVTAVRKGRNRDKGHKTMTIDTMYRTSAPGRSFSTRLGAFLLAVGTLVASYAERRRSRLALLEMTDDQLKDIGVSRADAWNEARRSPWDRL